MESSGSAPSGSSVRHRVSHDTRNRARAVAAAAKDDKKEYAQGRRDAAREPEFPRPLEPTGSGPGAGADPSRKKDRPRALRKLVVALVVLTAARAATEHAQRAGASHDASTEALARRVFSGIVGEDGFVAGGARSAPGSVCAPTAAPLVEIAPQYGELNKLLAEAGVSEAFPAQAAGGAAAVGTAVVCVCKTAAVSAPLTTPSLSMLTKPSLSSKV